MAEHTRPSSTKKLTQPKLPRNASFYLTDTDASFEDDANLTIPEEVDPFTSFPIPSLHWWNPLQWYSLITEPFLPKDKDTNHHESEMEGKEGQQQQQYDLNRFLKWTQYEVRYRRCVAREFARFLILPTSLMNVFVTIRFEKALTNDEDYPTTKVGPSPKLWRWLFLFIPFSQQVLGDLFLGNFPFLLDLIHDLLGFLAAVIPFLRLVSPQKMSLWTCLWCWYFSFFNSLVIVAGHPRLNVRDRVDLCRRAFTRSVDYIKWPLSVVWIVCVLLLGPIQTSGIVFGLAVKILVGRLKSLYYFRMKLLGS